MLLPSGGVRAGVGRPRMPELRTGLAEIREELAGLTQALERHRQQRRNELEAAPAILTRLTAIDARFA